MMMQRTTNPILHRLQQTLETNAPREEVAEALEAAEALGDTLPPLLAYRANERIDADRALGRRRICFGIACSGFVLLCAASAVGLTTVVTLRELNRDEGEFQQLVDSQQWEEAKAFLDSLDAEKKSDPRFVQGAQLVREELDRQQQQTEQFAKLVTQIRSDPDGLVDEAMVLQLQELARTEEEKAIVAEMSAIADEQSLQRQAGRVEEQTQRFEQLQKEVDAFFANESNTLDDKQRVSRIKELQQQLQTFVAENHLSNPELSEAAKQTAAILVREDKREQVRSDKQGLIDAITSSVGNTAGFLRSTKRFAETFPSDPMSKALTELSNHRQDTEATEAWIRVLGHSAFIKPQTVDSTQSQKWLTQLEQAQSLSANHPLEQIVRPYRGHYDAMAKRGDGMNKLRELFQSELLGRMYRYPNQNNGWYYSDLSPQRDSPTAHVIEYFTDLSLERDTKNFGSRYREQILPRAHFAGHSVFAEKALAAISTMTQSDFDPTVFRLINELRALDVATEIDPIFKLVLLRQLLQIGIQCSEPLAAGFGDWKDSLDATDFPWTANWMSPGDSDPQVVEARKTAQSLLQSVSDWDDRVKKMGESYRRFHEPRAAPPVWVGWVARQGDSYHALLQAEPSPGQLFVIAPDRSAEKMSMTDIGSVDNHPHVIEEPAAQVVGALICVFPQSETVPAKSNDPDSTSGGPATKTSDNTDRTSFFQR